MSGIVGIAREGRPAEVERVLDRKPTDAVRWQTEARTREREAFSRSVLDAVGANIAVLDRNGVITAVNQTWREFARNNGHASNGSTTGVGVDYLAVVKAAHGASTEGAAETLSGIQDVLAGRSAEFTIEYPCHSPDEQRWFMLRATPLTGDAGGAVLAHINITARKRADVALHDSELRYRRLFESSKDGILILDAETGMVVDVNPFLIELLGFSRDQFLLKKVWELGFLKDIIANKANFLELQQKGYVRYQDLPLETADGRRSHVEFVSNVYLVDHQKVIQCNIRDITERKQTEERLRESGERHRVLFEQARDLILVLELPPNGRPIIRDVNEEAVHVLGYTRDELYGKPISFLEAEASPDSLIRERQQGVQRGEARIFEARHRRKDGSIFDVEVSAREITLNGKRMAISIERDVTERKRAEEALRASQELLEGIINAIPVRVFWKDRNLVYLGCNAIFARDAGFADPKDIIGRDDYQMGWSDQAELYRGDDREVIESGCSKLLIEEPQTTPEGKTITLLSSKVPLRSSKGEISGLLGTYMDITERKRAEEEQAKLQEQLYISQKMESVGRLAGGVAHDFNNILTGISGYTELALERLDAASPMHEDLTEVLRLAKRAADLTRQLLAFSRRQPLAMQVLNINDTGADAKKMLKRVLGEDIDIQFTPAPDLGNVRADPGQMEQVLVNLALNARDAMPTGGKLTLETTNVELDADYAARHVHVIPGPYVMLAVSDTGHGMDAATKARLFEPFFTTKEKGKGTGLGLATVYGIVTQHGGNIWVYSEPGRGTTFKIFLPRVTEEVSDVKPAVEPEIARGEEMILVVEDEASVRAFAERVLKAHGYAVVIARSAEEAERVFLEHQKTISLLLTDVVLPGMNGRMLYDLLKGKQPDLEVLYMSGYTDNAIVHQGTLDTSVAFMQKPFTIETVARKVRQVLDS